MATSPTQRSLKLLKDMGLRAQVVERWNAHARVRQDLFGVIDIVALDPAARRVLGVQTTSRSNMSARVTKIKESAEAKDWSICCGPIYVHGWDKPKTRWRVRRIVMEYGEEGWTVYEIDD